MTDEIKGMPIELAGIVARVDTERGYPRCERLHGASGYLPPCSRPGGEPCKTPAEARADCPYHTSGYAKIGRDGPDYVLQVDDVIEAKLTPAERLRKVARAVEPAEAEEKP